MLIATSKATATPAATSMRLLNIAREAACAVAEASMTVFAEGRWTNNEMGAQAYALTVSILTLESELGPVCEACFAERHIRAMAQAAHLVIQHARLAVASGEALVSRISDWQLMDGCMEDALVPGYALIAKAA